MRRYTRILLTMIPLLLFWASVTSNADSILVQIRNLQEADSILVMLDEDPQTLRYVAWEDRLWVPRTTLRIRFIHRRFADAVASLDLSGSTGQDLEYRFSRFAFGNTRNLTSWYALRNQANLYIRTEPDSRIRFQGRDVGTGPGWYQVPFTEGANQVEITSRGRKPVQLRLDHGTERTFHVDAYTRPASRTYWSTAWIPGMPQLLERRHRMAFASVAALTATGLMVLDRTMAWRSSLDAYDLARERYRAASEAMLLERAAEAEAAERLAGRRARQATLAVAALAGFYTLHLVDAFTIPAGGFRRVTIIPDPYLAGGTVRIGVNP